MRVNEMKKEIMKEKILWKKKNEIKRKKQE